MLDAKIDDFSHVARMLTGFMHADYTPVPKGTMEDVHGLILVVEWWYRFLSVVLLTMTADVTRVYFWPWLMT